MHDQHPVLTDEKKKELLHTFRQSLEDVPDSHRFTDTDAAKKQFVMSYNWRKDNHIDRLPCATRQNKLPLLVNVRGYDAIDDGNVESKPGLSQTAIRIANCMGGDCFHKVDREGHPIMIDRTGYHDAKKLCHEVSIDEISIFQTASNEFLNRVIMPECSQKAGRIIFKETVIFDCTHMGIRQFQMTALHYLKSVIDTIQNYYPETLHRLFIVNAPGILHTIWRIVKPWLEQRTADKVFILNHAETPKVLLKYIAPENLPRFLGGSCTCDHIEGGCVPSVMLGNVPPLKVAEYNDNVSTPYNTDVMQAALEDNLYRNPT
ncbi:hypothetical protein O0I10_005100 [Lichtheimia ornata]|uniref:CRAL-TRIO domain-containing protein n=1 Tax=Lichtheimia ornata TaxID=688661 RepID=A0AAD7Y1R3_9FUNG|nr:uncharacterized protein O0I10_005100 [Lichtheimia ornata]KAJ8659062.1 hypothetical protein O0I10_005100 [Lichtheimia ornata]